MTWLMFAIRRRKANKQTSFCLAQNPLIGMLKHHKVKVFDTPRPTKSPVCASEWRKHKTCCLPTSLISYAERDIKTLRKTLSGVKKNASRLLQFIKENKKLIFGSLKRKAKKLQTAFVQEFKHELNVSLLAIRAVLHENKATKVSLHECFVRIQEIKTNSLCYMCSGRSAHFFLKGRGTSQTVQKTTVLLFGTEPAHRDAQTEQSDSVRQPSAEYVTSVCV